MIRFIRATIRARRIAKLTAARREHELKLAWANAFGQVGSTLVEISVHALRQRTISHRVRRRLQLRDVPLASEKEQ